jgi:replication fork protection complex subunit Tof1/Swi1
MIEDSDEDIEAFLEKEKMLRERTARVAEGCSIGTMKATGTKKRQRKGTEMAGRKKKRKREGESENGGRGEGR